MEVEYGIQPADLPMDGGDLGVQNEGGGDIGAQNGGGGGGGLGVPNENVGGAIQNQARVRHVCCMGAGHAGVLSMAVMADYHPEIIFRIVDTNPDLIQRWQGGGGGVSPFYEPGLEELLQIVRGRNLFFSQNMDEAIQQANLIFIAVDVPKKAKGIGAGSYFDLTDWENAVRRIKAVCPEPKVIVEKSTVPIDISNTIANILGQNQFGVQFLILSNPDFFSQGTAIQDLREPTRVVIGRKHGQGNVTVLQELYSRWVPQDRFIIVDDYKSIELGKIANNAFLAMKLMFMNMMSSFCDRLGADVDDVKRIAARDSRISENYLNPCVGFGGPGLIKDVCFMKYILNYYNYTEEAKFFGNIIKLNTKRKERFIAEMLNRMIALKKKRIAVLGFSYKKNTDDIRDSAAIDICRFLLYKEDSEIRIYDPKVPRDKILSCFRRGAKVSAHATPNAAWNNADAVCFLVDWDQFHTIQFQQMYQEMSKPAFFFDGCNCGFNYNQIRYLGFDLYVAGRPSI
ncbi:hypothetical protein L1049_010647 [Liquidambar formosana]|uniref:UDP-glucose 6-dehydrogenase n=1 Tax=Liquidambar formosana TaxID=63359 RepID=A0AAP0NBV7_LIQFO